MYSAQAKIVKRPGEKIDELESQVSQVSLHILSRVKRGLTAPIYYDL